MKIRLPFWATFFFILAECVLCSLGYWQIQRMAWKRELLAQVAEIAQQKSDDIPLQPQDFMKSEGFLRGFVMGTYMHGYEMKIRAKLQEGNLVAHLVTPLLLENGRDVVLINRGWMPDVPDLDISRPDGLVKVAGVVRLPQASNMFTPPNKPDKGEWYALNLKEIVLPKTSEYHLWGPMILFEEENLDGLYPHSVEGLPNLRNNHAQYALFWYAMALVLLGIFMIRFARKSL